MEPMVTLKGHDRSRDGGAVVAGERGASDQISLLSVSSVVNIPNNNASGLFIDGFSISTVGTIGC